RRAEELLVGLFGRPRFAELAAGLTPQAVLGAREVPDEPVTRGVDEVGARELGPDLGAHGPAAHTRHDALALDVGRVELAHIRTVEQPDVQLCPHGIHHYRVPYDGAALRVAVLCLDVECADHAALAREALDTVGGRPVLPHSHFRGRVASEHRPV